MLTKLFNWYLYSKPNLKHVAFRSIIEALEMLRKDCFISLKFLVATPLSDGDINAIV